jgi:hypothetical protein
VFCIQTLPALELQIFPKSLFFYVSSGLQLLLIIIKILICLNVCFYNLSQRKIQLTYAITYPHHKSDALAISNLYIQDLDFRKLFIFVTSDATGNIFILLSLLSIDRNFISPFQIIHIYHIQNYSSSLSFRESWIHKGWHLKQRHSYWVAYFSGSQPFETRGPLSNFVSWSRTTTDNLGIG